MSDSATSPLLGNRPSASRRSSQQSKTSTKSRHSNKAADTSESTPLLSRPDEDRSYGDAPPPQEDEQTDTRSQSWLRGLWSSDSGEKRKRRWPTIVSLTILTILVLLILGFGFAAPAVVKEYAQEALVFEPRDLSIDSFTSTGIIARITGDFKLDGSRVKKKAVRDLGRAGTWIAKAVETKESYVEVRVPKYGNFLLGTAMIPPITVSIRDGQVTHLDILANATAGDSVAIKAIAQDWLRGNVDSLSVHALAEVSLKSGIFGLGTQHIGQTLDLSGEHYSCQHLVSTNGHLQEAICLHCLRTIFPG